MNNYSFGTILSLLFDIKKQYKAPHLTKRLEKEPTEYTCPRAVVQQIYIWHLFLPYISLK